MSHKCNGLQVPKQMLDQTTAGFEQTRDPGWSGADGGAMPGDGGAMPGDSSLFLAHGRKAHPPSVDLPCWRKVSPFKTKAWLL